MITNFKKHWYDRSANFEYDDVIDSTILFFLLELYTPPTDWFIMNKHIGIGITFQGMRSTM